MRLQTVHFKRDCCIDAPDLHCGDRPYSSSTSSLWKLIWPSVIAEEIIHSLFWSPGLTWQLSFSPVLALFDRVSFLTSFDCPDSLRLPYSIFALPVSCVQAVVSAAEKHRSAIDIRESIAALLDALASAQADDCKMLVAHHATPVSAMSPCVPCTRKCSHH